MNYYFLLEIILISNIRKLGFRLTWWVEWVSALSWEPFGAWKKISTKSLARRALGPRYCIIICFSHSALKKKLSIRKWLNSGGSLLIWPIRSLPCLAEQVLIQWYGRHSVRIHKWRISGCLISPLQQISRQAQWDSIRTVSAFSFCFFFSPSNARQNIHYHISRSARLVGYYSSIYLNIVLVQSAWFLVSRSSHLFIPTCKLEWLVWILVRFFWNGSSLKEKNVKTKLR